MKKLFAVLLVVGLGAYYFISQVNDVAPDGIRTLSAEESKTIVGGTVRGIATPQGIIWTSTECVSYTCYVVGSEEPCENLSDDSPCTYCTVPRDGFACQTATAIKNCGLSGYNGGCGIKYTGHCAYSNGHLYCYVGSSDGKACLNCSDGYGGIDEYNPACGPATNCTMYYGEV